MNEWIRMMNGEITPDDPEGRELLERGVSDLENLLDDDDSKIEALIAQTIAGRLQSGLSDDTFRQLLASLSILSGEDLAFFLAWTLEEGDPDRLTLLGDMASKRVMGFLRFLLANHGADIARAKLIWNELPDDWVAASKEIHYDEFRESEVLRLRIEKYNGEQVLLEGTPDSMDFS